MKIVNVEDFFHPYAGYQINILAKYIQKAGHDVTIITSELDKIPDYLTAFFGKDNIEKKDEEYSSKYGVRIIRIPVLKFISGRAIFGKRLEEEIRKLQPDIVFSHGNDTVSGMQMIHYCTKNNIPLVTDSHMLEMASQNKFNKVFRWFYRRTIAKKINRCEIPVIRTQDDDYVIRCLGVKAELSPYIPLGSDLLLFKPDQVQRLKTREELGISQDSFVVMYAGKIDEAKGGLFLANAIKEKIESNKEIVFLLVGTPAGNNKSLIQECLKRSRNKIVSVQTQPYIRLSKYYQAADIALFPRQCSLSFYDVQATGLPVVFEDNSINIQRAGYNNALLFKQGDVDDFRDKIQLFASMDPYEFENYRNNAKNYIVENYNYNRISERYLDVIIKEYDKRSSND